MTTSASAVAVSTHEQAVSVSMSLTTADQMAATLTQHANSFRAAGLDVPDWLHTVIDPLQRVVDHAITRALAGDDTEPCSNSDTTLLTYLTNPALALDTTAGTCSVLLPGIHTPLDAASQAIQFLATECEQLLPFDATDPDLSLQIHEPATVHLRVCNSPQHTTHIHPASAADEDAIVITRVEIV